MKRKIISLLLSLLLLVTTFFAVNLPVSAADKTDWVIGPSAQYITHNNKRYLPFESINYCYVSFGAGDITEGLFNESDYYDVSPEFIDEQTEKRYKESYISMSDDTKEKFVSVSLISDNYDWFADKVYVEESFMDEYTKIANGVSDYYLTDNYVSWSLTIDGANIANWYQGEQITVKGGDLGLYETFYLYATDMKTPDFNGFGFHAECAAIYRDTDNDTLYLARYSDYDKTSFYSDGTFCPDYNEDVTLFKLENQELHAELIEYYNEEYEDELDWLVPGESNGENTFVGLIICGALFVVLSLFLLVFSVVMLCVIKDKKYHRAYIAILIGSVLVLAASVAVIILFI